MKFLLIALLLIWELFSKIQTGMGLKCFLSINTECTQLLTHQLSESKNSLPETELEVIKRNLTICILDRSQKDNTRNCTEENSKCSQLTIKLNDGDKTWVRFCNGSNGSSCENFRHSLLTYHKSRVDHAGCAYCDTDNCNIDLEDNSSLEEDNSTPQDNSKPEGNSKQEDDSTPEDMSLNCFITTKNTQCMTEALTLEGVIQTSEVNIHVDKFYVDAARDQLVSCVKKIRNEKLNRCDEDDKGCYTLTVKLKGDTPTSFKFCDKPKHIPCEDYKKIFERLALKNDVDYATCTHCSANRCNLNPIPRLTGGNTISDETVTPEALKYNRANEMSYVAALVLMIPLLVSLF